MEANGVSDKREFISYLFQFAENIYSHDTERFYTGNMEGLIHDTPVYSSVEDDDANNRRDPARRQDRTLVLVTLDDGDNIRGLYGDDVCEEAICVLSKAIQRNLRTEDQVVRIFPDRFAIILVGADFVQANRVVLKRLEHLLHGDIAMTIGRERVLIRGRIRVLAYDKHKTPAENIRSAHI